MPKVEDCSCKRHKLFAKKMNLEVLKQQHLECRGKPCVSIMHLEIFLKSFLIGMMCSFQTLKKFRKKIIYKKLGVKNKARVASLIVDQTQQLRVFCCVSRLNALQRRCTPRMATRWHNWLLSHAELMDG